MAKRKPKVRTFDNDTGQSLGSGASGTWGDAVTPQWFASPTDPNFMEARVPTGTPYPTDIVGFSAITGWPDATQDTWIAPTSGAIWSGKITAATDTIAATADQIASAGGAVLATAEGFVKNLLPIVIGLAVLYVMWSEKKS